MAAKTRSTIWATRIAATTALLIVALFILIGAFPVSWLRGLAEGRIGKALGTEVRIGRISRTPWFSFAPTIQVHDVSVAQPAWAGSGKLLSIRMAETRVSVFTLMVGDFRPKTLRIDGLEANLVRDANRRANWTGKGGSGGGGGVPALSELTVTNSRFTLRDERRALRIAGTIAADARQGLRIAGHGRFHGAPAAIVAGGGRIAGIDPSAPYPFRAKFSSPLLDLEANGMMAGVLRTSQFDARVSTKGQDFEYLDDIIGAGLFRTQPIALTARVRRAHPEWRIEGLAGSIGRSRLTGNAVIRKVDGRSKIDGSIHATQLDFNDLSSDEGIAQRQALKARIGKRVIPATRINLMKLGKTDGRLRVRADRLLVDGGSIFRSLSGTFVLDRRTLTVPDLVARLSRGQISGRVLVVQRQGSPLLTIDARVSGTTLEQMFGSAKEVSGPVRGRIRLSGRGNTIREALARGNGQIAVHAGPGQIKAVVAQILAQDLARAVGQALGGRDERVALNCVVADFAVRNGVMTPSPFVVDTALSVGRGSGSIILDGERIALAISGASKRKSLLRLADPIRINGTFSAPALSVAGIGTSQKPRSRTLLKVVGKSIGQLFDGKKAPVARPVSNCKSVVASFVG